MKLALVSPHLPPAATDQAMALYTLMSGINASHYCTIGPAGSHVRGPGPALLGSAHILTPSFAPRPPEVKVPAE